MAASKYTDRVKAKVWTPSMTLEIEGNRAGVIASIFATLNGKTQAAVLEELRKNYVLTSSEEQEVPL